jgi:hypothetical protein
LLYLVSSGADVGADGHGNCLGEQLLTPGNTLGRVLANDEVVAPPEQRNEQEANESGSDEQGRSSLGHSRPGRATRCNTYV